MPELSQVEDLVLNCIRDNTGGKVHVNNLFAAIRSSYVPFTDTEIVSAIWSLKDRRKIDVNAMGELELYRPRVSRPVAAAAV